MKKLKEDKIKKNHKLSELKKQKSNMINKKNYFKKE